MLDQLMETALSIKNLASALASLFGARTEKPTPPATAAAPWPNPADEREVDAATMARWIELIGAGSRELADATEPAATEALRADDEYLLWEVLGDADLAVCADWKDDDSVAAGIDSVSRTLGLGVFEAPPGPPAGFNRCRELFRAWEAWLAARGYRLVAIDTGGDDFVAIAVRTTDFDELRQLSEALSIPLAEPARVYGL